MENTYCFSYRSNWYSSAVVPKGVWLCWMLSSDWFLGALWFWPWAGWYRQLTHQPGHHTGEAFYTATALPKVSTLSAFSLPLLALESCRKEVLDLCASCGSLEILLTEAKEAISDSGLLSFLLLRRGVCEWGVTGSTRVGLKLLLLLLTRSQRVGWGGGRQEVHWISFRGARKSTVHKLE